MEFDFVHWKSIAFIFGHFYPVFSFWTLKIFQYSIGIQCQQVSSIFNLKKKNFQLSCLDFEIFSKIFWVPSVAIAFHWSSTVYVFTSSGHLFDCCSTHSAVCKQFHIVIHSLYMLVFSCMVLVLFHFWHSIKIFSKSFYICKYFCICPPSIDSWSHTSRYNLAVCAQF